MISNIKTLIAKLDPVCKKSLEAAAGLCVQHKHFTVELEHFLLELLKQEKTDLRIILKHYDLPLESVQHALKDSLERLKKGSTRTPTMSPHIFKLVETAWVLSSIELNAPQIRSGALLLALLSQEMLRGIVVQNFALLLKIPRERLEQELKEIIKQSPEEVIKNSSPLSSAAPASLDPHPTASSDGPSDGKNASNEQPALQRYTIDLTAQAQHGSIDPIRGRDHPIRQMIDILARRRQNNPILTGDAGVGKTAVVEGLALRIAAGNVPPHLKDVRILSLDLGLLEAGAGLKGEFEERLNTVISEIQSSLQPIILFIDEAHRLIGSGGPEGQNDAANLLKPALARGELKTIAATTWDEYKKYFEKDPALTRRFQVVKIEEPNEEQACDMMRGLIEKLETHHGVTILEEAVLAAVRLSNKYISGRKLPDKAISVLDTACARVAVGHSTQPEALESLEHQIESLCIEKKILTREQQEGSNHQETLKDIQKRTEEFIQKKQEMTTLWHEERELAQTLIDLQKQIRAHTFPDPNSDSKAKNIKDANPPLAALQKHFQEKKYAYDALTKEHLLVPVFVSERIIAEVIASWTGIPVGKMMRDEIQTVLDLQSIMQQRLIGQTQALQSLTKHIWTHRAHLEDEKKPVGVFLLTGPSGVGKTETALCLADTLYGGERNLITINMSEYQEPYTVSALKGSPPGYVGYGQGGVLTEAVRRNPYSVVLLDEVEKAHPDVMELFYQVFDKGLMEDGEGIEINFRNTVILMTSNLGTEVITEHCQADRSPPVEKVREHLHPVLARHFKPALLARMSIVPYYPLTQEDIIQIVGLKLNAIKNRYESAHKADLTYNQEVPERIAERCLAADSGARRIDFLLNQNLLPQLSQEILRRATEEKSMGPVTIHLTEAGELTCTFL